MQTEYRNEREATDTQLKLGQLKYQGSIRTYLMEFCAFNNFAWATGEGLHEKIDLAMPDSILDMQFNQNPDDFEDDALFLQATYRAGLQVEKKKALKQAKEVMQTGSTTTQRKESQDSAKTQPEKKEQNPMPPKKLWEAKEKNEKFGG